MQEVKAKHEEMQEVRKKEEEALKLESAIKVNLIKKYIYSNCSEKNEFNFYHQFFRSKTKKKRKKSQTIR